MAIFGPKPWVNRFGKNGNFLTFGTSCFYSLERCFFVLEVVKDIFLAYLAKKKEVGKMTIFRRNPWVNPFGKMAIFRLFELLVFIA